MRKNIKIYLLIFPVIILLVFLAINYFNYYTYKKEKNYVKAYCFYLSMYYHGEGCVNFRNFKNGKSLLKHAKKAFRETFNADFRTPKLIADNGLYIEPQDATGRISIYTYSKRKKSKNKVIDMDSYYNLVFSSYLLNNYRINLFDIDSVDYCRIHPKHTKFFFRGNIVKHSNTVIPSSVYEKIYKLKKLYTDSTEYGFYLHGIKKNEMFKFELTCDLERLDKESIIKTADSLFNAGEKMPNNFDEVYIPVKE